MKLLLAEIENVRECIRKLDADEITDKTKVAEERAYLVRCFDRRESPILYLGEILKDELGESKADKAKSAEIDALIEDVLNDIEESGYVGLNPKYPIKRRRGRPSGTTRHKSLNPRTRVNLTEHGYRFSMTSDFSCILDELHKPPEYKISMYEGLTADKAIEVIKTLVEAAKAKKNEGWVKSESWWRGAFQKDVYLRFRDEQIQRGKKANGHNGEWRIITDGEFDSLSAKGKYHFRDNVN